MFLPRSGRVLPLTCETTTRIDKEMLFDSARLRVGHVVVRPASPGCGEVEQQSVNVLAFPIDGVFAKHMATQRMIPVLPDDSLRQGDVQRLA